MKLKYIINFAVIILILNGISCKEKPTEPQIEEFPPGYQHDIPWPSLADSSWPINHADPQSSGRSKYKGPQLGILEMIVETPELQSGIVIGKDSTIYMTTSTFHPEHRGLYAYNLDGTLKWKSILGFSYSTPIVGNDGTIYVNDQFFISAINYDGTIKWKHNRTEPFYSLRAFNIDKSGNLYYLDSQYNLNVLNKEGELIWSFQDNDFLLDAINDLAFSPDGKTIYTTGKTASVIAIDIVNKNLKWKYKHLYSGTITPPIIDSQGNVYFPSADENGQKSFIALNENGNLKWKFIINKVVNQQGTFDKNGNIYFATDTLYSLNYNGELRWKIKLEFNLYASLISDLENNIYVIGGFAPNNMVTKINDKGEIIWQASLGTISNTSSSAAIFNNRLYIPSNNEQNFAIIK